MDPVFRIGLLLALRSDTFASLACPSASQFQKATCAMSLLPASPAKCEYAEEKTADCRSCGACCSFSREWPRFTMEDDAALALIPEMFVNEAATGMRCNGDRCSALLGEVGQSTSCNIYHLRPDVCRACQPGDEACRIARDHFKLDTAPSSLM